MSIGWNQREQCNVVFSTTTGFFRQKFHCMKWVFHGKQDRVFGVFRRRVHSFDAF